MRPTTLYHTANRYVILSILVVFSMTGCSLRKHCVDPQVTLPEQIIDTIASDSMSLADLHWSEIFADTLLQSLVQQTLTYNKDLLAAAARMQELEKLHRVAKADFFPSLNAEAHIDYETTRHTNSTPANDLEVAAVGTLSWEVDFFGRVRWANREALAKYLASVEGQRALQMTLVAEVVTAYVELMALDNELRIITRTVETRKEDRDKAKLRFEGGLTSEIPYQQAEVEYASTAALIPDLQRKIESKENHIALLTGQMPMAIERSDIRTYQKNQVELAVGFPSDLLKRRPDMRAEEQNLKAAMARAGIAWADRFPRFTINLQGGLENDAFRGFLAAPWTYMIGELTSPIFSFGKRKARYNAAVKAYDAQRYQYEKKVLQCFQEVNNAVVGYSSASEKVVLMQNLHDAALKYVELANFQHINGHISYMDVLDAQRSYLNAEIDLSNAIRDEYIAMITLYKSLGGGWTE